MKTTKKLLSLILTAILVIFTALLPVSAEEPVLPESEHNYANSFYQEWEYVHPEETDFLWVTFDENTFLENGDYYDIYFEEGLVARVEVGTSHFISLPRHYMNGTNGTAIVRGWGKDCEVVCCKNWEDKDVIPVVTAAGLTKTMAPRNKETITEYSIPSPKSDVHDFYRNYCLAVDGKAEQIVTHKELMRVMKVMEAAFESDAAGKPVEFKDTI